MNPFKKAKTKDCDSEMEASETPVAKPQTKPSFPPSFKKLGAKIKNKKK